MAKNKYDFIQELLENKKLTPAQRERVLLLTKEEIKNDVSIGLDLEERVKLLEKKINVDIYENFSKDDREEVTIFNFPNFFINSNKIYSFLREYNSNPILKSTCHLIDENELITIKKILGEENYNFEKHFELIFSEFSELIKKYSSIGGSNVVTLTRGYLIGLNYKGDEKVKWDKNMSINWQCDELLSWVKNNPSIPPNIDEDLHETFDSIGFTFEPIIPNLKLIEENGIVRTTLNSFSEVVLYYKYLFHLRAENSLNKILQNNFQNKWEKKIEINYDELNSIEHFTDVSKLFQFYEKVIDLIIKCHNIENHDLPIVKLKFYRKNKEVYFTIHHVNSVYLKDEIEIQNRPGDSIFNLIHNQVNGIGDFYIKAKLKSNNNAIIYYWDFRVKQENKIRIEILEEEITGVEYILKMRQ